MTKIIVALAGDGIGPEIMSAGLQVLATIAKKIGFDYQVKEKAFGGLVVLELMRSVIPCQQIL